jgi:ribosomal protein S18 acetylase RimI-like enzyme
VGRSRRAVPAEVDAAIAVWLRAERARGVARSAADVAVIRARLTSQDTIVLVVERADRIAGLATGEPARTEHGRGALIPGLAHIGMVFVDPEHWGTGLGGVLVDDLLTALRTAGYRRAQLWVRIGNRRARRLYAGRGFQPTGEAGTDDTGEPIMLMARDL